MITRFAPLPVLLLVLASCATDRQAAPNRADLASEDLRSLQGRWECPLGDARPDGGVRAVKEVAGNSETVTYFDAAGKVVHAHTADFEVKALEHVRLFTYWNLRVTQGPSASAKPADGVKRTYIYRVDGDFCHEAHGLLADAPPGSKPKVYTWTRVK